MSLEDGRLQAFARLGARRVFERNEWSESNFAAYEEDKRRRLGDAADRPTGLAYKKLMR
jgi:hypothetical protein